MTYPKSLATIVLTLAMCSGCLYKPSDILARRITLAINNRDRIELYNLTNGNNELDKILDSDTVVATMLPNSSGSHQSGLSVQATRILSIPGGRSGIFTVDYSVFVDNDCNINVICIK